MPSRLNELLEERFRALRVGMSNVDRAEYLGTDEATYSRIINGRRKLSRQKAADWSAKLCPEDAAAAAEFESKLLSLEVTVARHKRSVEEFCDDIVNQGGSVAADRIVELLEALASPDTVLNPLVIIEYRDGPRAGPDAKYQKLGLPLAKAVAGGIHVAMVVPFQTRDPSTRRPADRAGASSAMKYMIDIHDDCRATYSRFRGLAQGILGKEKAGDIDDRLRLYVPGGDVEVTLSPGFQAKIFYVQFDDRQTLERHHKVFQWVSTPPQDLLIYRGGHVKAEALRDSFFPIPHAFDLPLEPRDTSRRLPRLPSGDEGRRERATLNEKLKIRWPDSGLPFGKSLWTSDHDPR